MSVVAWPNRSSNAALGFPRPHVATAVDDVEHRVGSAVTPFAAPDLGRDPHLDRRSMITTICTAQVLHHGVDTVVDRQAARHRALPEADVHDESLALSPPPS